MPHLHGGDGEGSPADLLPEPRAIPLLPCLLSHWRHVRWRLRRPPTEGHGSAVDDVATSARPSVRDGLPACGLLVLRVSDHGHHDPVLRSMPVHWQVHTPVPEAHLSCCPTVRLHMAAMCTQYEQHTSWHDLYQ